MLFNDSGFVRFRMGNEATEPTSAGEAAITASTVANTVEMQQQQATMVCFHQFLSGPNSENQ